VERIPLPERAPPLHSGPERVQLESWLDFQRTTLLIKCADLDVDQLRRQPVATSLLSLLGLLRHMTFVEQVWFDAVFSGVEAPEYFKRAEDRDADFRDLDSATLDEVYELFLTACARSREVASGHDLDEMAAVERRGRHVDLRWIYVHLIEEYARHLGHADLLRELVDGATGY